MIFDLPPMQPPVPEIRLAQNHQEEAIRAGMRYVGCNREELILAEIVWLTLSGLDFKGLILYYNVRNTVDLRNYKKAIASANSRGIKVAMVVCNMTPPGSYYQTSGGVPWYILGPNKYEAANIHGGWVRVWIQR